MHGSVIVVCGGAALNKRAKVKDTSVVYACVWLYVDAYYKHKAKGEVMLSKSKCANPQRT